MFLAMRLQMIQSGTETNTKARSKSPLGIQMPDDFPMQPYWEVREHCRHKMEITSPIVEKARAFSAAWKAIAYRFRGLADHDQSFTIAISQDGNGHSGRYVQERELFCFFVSGVAVVDSFAYGIYFLGSISRPDEFSTKRPWDITLPKTDELFQSIFPKLGITQGLRGLITDSSFQQWKEIRNVLVHRCTPGRIIHGSTRELVTDLHDIWQLQNILLNPETTGSRRKWLSETLKGLLSDAQEFVEKYI